MYQNFPCRQLHHAIDRKILRVVADPNRLRILLLLKGEELSVAELQEILAHGPKHHLHPPLAAQAGGPGGRPAHRQEQPLPRFACTPRRRRLLWTRFSTRPRTRSPKPRRTRPPCAACCASARTRCARSLTSVAGRLGKDYVPGKSWKSLAEALLRLMPPMVDRRSGRRRGRLRAAARPARQESDRRRLPRPK